VNRELSRESSRKRTRFSWNAIFKTLLRHNWQVYPHGRHRRGLPRKQIMAMVDWRGGRWGRGVNAIIAEEMHHSERGMVGVGRSGSDIVRPGRMCKRKRMRGGKRGKGTEIARGQRRDTKYRS